MATTYNSTRATSTQAAKFLSGIVEDDCSFAISAAFVINDVLNLFKIPAGAKILDMMIFLPQLDSNGTPLLTIDVGDTANGAQQYVAASTKGRAAAGSIISGANDVVATSMAVKYTADDTLAMKIHAAPATGVSTGTIRAWVKYQIDDKA